MEINKYSPFTNEEFAVMVEEMKSLGVFLPEHQMSKMWERCTRIRGKKENQPCSCKSSGSLWKRCVDDINQFIKERV